MLVNEYYYFDTTNSTGQPMPSVGCGAILNLAEGKFSDSDVNVKVGISDAERVNGVEPEYKSNHDVRKSEVFFSSEQWIFDLIWPFMEKANESAGWNYDITGCEAVQITKYDNSGYYHWHMDGYGCHLAKYDKPENQWLDGKVRKLSMTIILNDDFEVGQLQLCSLKPSLDGGCNATECTPPVEGMGNVIVFPSFLMHRVMPVTSGVRYSLVAWFVGPPFK